jgi:hypothetical protein
MSFSWRPDQAVNPLQNIFWTLRNIPFSYGKNASFNYISTYGIICVKMFLARPGQGSI